MSQNVLGQPLTLCSTDPLTGWYRDGCCNTDANDHGSHTVCARMTDAFLAFSKAHGNDLVTPRPEFGFPGLKAGDYWCVCVSRWAEAYAAGVAPPVKLGACHERALDLVSLESLTALALDAV
ncbi:MAG: DUF2237 family protein [Rhodothalassiaceae bacterium]